MTAPTSERRTLFAGWLRRYQPRHGDWQPAHRIRTDRADARDHQHGLDLDRLRATLAAQVDFAGLPTPAVRVTSRGAR